MPVKRYGYPQNRRWIFVWVANLQARSTFGKEDRIWPAADLLAVAL